MSEEVEIDGLTDYQKLPSVPEEVLRIRRRSRYDKVIQDAKKSTIKMTFKDEKRANSVYLALRSRVKKDRAKLAVRRKGSDVYVFAEKATK